MEDIDLNCIYQKIKKEKTSPTNSFGCQSSTQLEDLGVTHLGALCFRVICILHALMHMCMWPVNYCHPGTASAEA